MRLIQWSGFALVVGCGAGELESTEARAPIVVALPEGKTFESPLEVRLEADSPSAIFYTLDGTSPNGLDALRYEDPLTLDDTTLLSFVARSDEGLWSARGTELYEHFVPPEPFRPLERALEVSEDVVFFTAEPGEETLEETIRVRSVGLQAVRFDAVYISAQGAFHEPGVFEMEAPSLTSLPPGETMDILIRYRVTQTLRTAELVLETNDLKAEDGRWTILLGGRLATW